MDSLRCPSVAFGNRRRPSPFLIKQIHSHELKDEGQCLSQHNEGWPPKTALKTHRMLNHHIGMIILWDWIPSQWVTTLLQLHFISAWDLAVCSLAESTCHGMLITRIPFRKYLPNSRSHLMFVSAVTLLTRSIFFFDFQAKFSNVDFYFCVTQWWLWLC